MCGQPLARSASLLERPLFKLPHCRTVTLCKSRQATGMNQNIMRHGKATSASSAKLLSIV